MLYPSSSLNGDSRTYFAAMVPRSGSRRGPARSGVSQRGPTPPDQPLSHLTGLSEASGHILVGRLDPVACAAIAYDGSATVAILRRQAAESAPQLIQRLDAAVAQARRSGSPVDDINM